MIKNIHPQVLKNKNQAFVLIEVLVACSIISIITFSLINAATKGIQLSELALRQTQANFLLEEGGEAVKSIRDTDWANISPSIITIGTTYYLSYNISTNWSLSTSSSSPNNPIDLFTRTIIFSAVYRDATTQDIVTGGTLDPGTEKVTITVSWPASIGTSSKTLSFYISNIFN